MFCVQGEEQGVRIKSIWKGSRNFELKIFTHALNGGASRRKIFYNMANFQLYRKLTTPTLLFIKHAGNLRCAV